jgi:hypothetical protein
MTKLKQLVCSKIKRFNTVDKSKEKKSDGEDKHNEETEQENTELARLKESGTKPKKVMRQSCKKCEKKCEKALVFGIGTPITAGNRAGRAFSSLRWPYWGIDP